MTEVPLYATARYSSQARDNRLRALTRSSSEERGGARGGAVDVANRDELVLFSVAKPPCKGRM